MHENIGIFSVSVDELIGFFKVLDNIVIFSIVGLNNLMEVDHFLRVLKGCLNAGSEDGPDFVFP